MNRKIVVPAAAVLLAAGAGAAWWAWAPDRAEDRPLAVGEVEVRSADLPATDGLEAKVGDVVHGAHPGIFPDSRSAWRLPDGSYLVVDRDKAPPKEVASELDLAADDVRRTTATGTAAEAAAALEQLADLTVQSRGLQTVLVAPFADALEDGTSTDRWAVTRTLDGASNMETRVVAGAGVDALLAQWHSPGATVLLDLRNDDEEK